MTPVAAGRAGCVGILSAMAVFVAPPSRATDTAEVRASLSVPSVTMSAGQAIARRSVGVAVQSDLLDVDASVDICARPQPAAFPSDVGPACAEPGASSGIPANLGQRFGLMVKIPRWNADAPLIDLTLRRWTAASGAARGETAGAGTAAGVSITQPLESIDVGVGFATPVGAAGTDGRWRSVYAVLAWHMAPRTSVEFIADRGFETSTGSVDRTLTLRIAHATPHGAARLVAWTTRALDDRSSALRAGVGFDLAF